MVDKLLLQEYLPAEGKNQLILTGPIDYSHLSKYYEQLLNRYSSKKIQTILEIFPSETNPVDSELRKRGYNVTSVPFSLKINAVSENEDGDHFIIGETFRLPKLKEKFDAIIVSHGIFGQIIQNDDINSFLSHVNSILNPSGILLAETWHFNGINKETRTKKGHKDWDLITSEKGDRSIIRLTNSKLNILTSILEVELKYIIEYELEKRIEKYNETHLYRLYNVSEISSLFSSNNFYPKTILKMNGFDEPDIDTFRMMNVVEKV